MSAGRFYAVVPLGDYSRRAAGGATRPDRDVTRARRLLGHGRPVKGQRHGTVMKQTDACGWNIRTEIGLAC